MPHTSLDSQSLSATSMSKQQGKSPSSDSMPFQSRPHSESTSKTNEQGASLVMEAKREGKNIASPSDHTPVFHELDLLERYGKKLQLVKQVASKWKRVATRLYFSQEKIDAISLDSHHQCDPACHTMLA